MVKKTCKTALDTVSTEDMLQLSFPRRIDLERVLVLLVWGFPAHCCFRTVAFQYSHVTSDVT